VEMTSRRRWAIVVAVVALAGAAWFVSAGHREGTIDPVEPASSDEIPIDPDGRTLTVRLECLPAGAQVAWTVELGEGDARRVLTGRGAGTRRIPGLPKGRYFVKVTAPGFNGAADVATVDEEPTPIVLTLAQLGRIEGVVRSETGEPIEGATVMAWMSDDDLILARSADGALLTDPPNTDTNFDGSFEFSDLVPTRRISVVAHDDRIELLPATTSAQIEPGGTAFVELELAPAGRVYGRLRWMNGEPAEGQMLTFRCYPAVLWQRPGWPTREGGQFNSRHYPVGSRVRIEGLFRRRGLHEIFRHEIASLGRCDVDLGTVGPARTRLEFRLPEAPSRLDGVRLALTIDTPLQGSEPRVVTDIPFDDDRRAWIAGVPLGSVVRYNIRAAEQVASGQFTLRENNATIDASFDRPRKTMRPLASVDVDVANDGPCHVVATDENGTFVTDLTPMGPHGRAHFELPPGLYTIYALTDGSWAKRSVEIRGDVSLRLEPKLPTIPIRFVVIQGKKPLAGAQVIVRGFGPRRGRNWRVWATADDRGFVSVRRVPNSVGAIALLILDDAGRGYEAIVQRAGAAATRAGHEIVVLIPRR